MKRIFAILTVLAVTFTIASVESLASNSTVNRHFDYSNFYRISASHSFQVDVTFADKFSVDVTVPDFIEPYLKVKNSSGKLVISLEKLPASVRNQLNRSKGRLEAKVVMPYLTAVELSGASRLNANGAIDLGNKNLDIDISGASQLEELQVKGVDRLSIDLSGATGCKLDADARDMHIDVSGSSRLDWKGTALSADIECSGASGARLEGDVNRVSIDCSGASRVVCTGKTEVANIELSGASKGEIAVSGKLRYELSGASSLRVKDLGASMSGEVSRGSKISVSK